MFNNSQIVATHIFTMIITMFSKAGISGSSIHLLPHSLISIYSSPTEHKAFFYALGTQREDSYSQGVYTPQRDDIN